MSMLRNISIQILVVAMLSACDPNPVSPENRINPVQAPGLIPAIPKGFHCPLIPNGFDPVGSIYRVTKDGTYYRVADRSNDQVVLKGLKTNVKIADYAFQHKQKSSADLSVSFLKRVLPGLSAKARVKREFLIDITVKNMHANIIYDTEADYIRDWFGKTLKPKPHNRYFLVREAIFAGSVSYGISTLDLRQAGIKAKIDNVIDSSANAVFADNGNKLVIKQTFTPSTQVCIKVAEIEILQQGIRGGAVAVALKPADETTVATIKRIGIQ